MFETVVERREEQLVLTVPKEMQVELQLKQGDHLQIDVRSGPAAPTRRSRFAPGQLIREQASILHELEPNREWVDAKPVGREIL